MVALAQVDAEADTAAYPTILNLFADPASAPAGLTDWDRSYLTALYDAELNQLQPSHHHVRPQLRLSAVGQDERGVACRHSTAAPPA